MQARTLALLSLALVLGGGVSWLLGGLEAPRAIAGLFLAGEEPAAGRELSWVELAERDAELEDLEAELDALDSPFWREEASDEIHEGPEPEPRRDELFEDSPAPPEPGAYEGELVREYHESGHLLFEAEQSQREDGVWVVDGEWTSYHENGQVQESGAYAMGVEDGHWRWFDVDGQEIAQGRFEAGEREGAWTFWYSNGNKQMDARYAGGEGAGNWTLYYEDGSPWAAGQYVDGEISGAWTIWDESGEVNPERSGYYEHGERVSD